MTTVKTYEDLMALPTGTAFSVRLPKTMSWKERHGIFYRTANRQVTLTLRGGEKITGVLDETPGYFAQGTKSGPRLWLRVPGRKTRKGIDIREVQHMKGFKAPSLGEALSAFILLNSSNPTEEQVAESLETARLM